MKMKCKCLYCGQEFELSCADSEYVRDGSGPASGGGDHLVWDWEDRCPHCYATVGLTLRLWAGEGGGSESRTVEGNHVELIEGFCLPDGSE